jgi:hypothetical protein
VLVFEKQVFRDLTRVIMPVEAGEQKGRETFGFPDDFVRHLEASRH